MSFNDFEEYKKQGEPSQKQKAENWAIAIGLQQVDGLTPSAYLIETAKENIEGKIDSQEVKDRIYSYYKTHKGKLETADTQQADKVSLHIAEILADESFTFSPIVLIGIHRKLFSDVFPEMAGKVRDYNITKNEIVLNSDTVRYANHLDIKDTLEYDFEKEKKFEYKPLSKQVKVQRIAEFISGIWQIHPFGEGNTRTIAVFTIKYLRTMGFDANNEYFERNAKYFRDALVRANYQNLENEVTYTIKYLNEFFDNLLFGGTNILDSNRLLVNVVVNDKDVVVNKQNVVVNDKDVVVNDKILKLLKENPNFTAKELADILNKTPRTIQRAIAKLREEKKLTRIGSDKTGHWEVLKDGGTNE